MVLGSLLWGSNNNNNNSNNHSNNGSLQPSLPRTTSSGSSTEGSYHSSNERQSLINDNSRRHHRNYHDESETEFTEAWEDLVVDTKQQQQQQQQKPINTVNKNLRPPRSHQRRKHPTSVDNGGNDDTMDMSSSSLFDVNTVHNLRETLKQIQSTTRRSVTNSVRRVQSAIAEHTGSIGMLGSLSIAINNLTGPAMLSLPATFARSGIIPTTLTLVFVCILSALCSLHMASVISKVPENQDFKQGVEFPEAFRVFWGTKWFVLANWLFFACITCLNVSSLVDNAQVLDTFLGHCNPYGGAWALAVDPIHMNATITNWTPDICSEHLLYKGGCVPFATASEEDEDVLILTIGYVLTAVLFFPLAMMDLTENVQWQILGFCILLITSVQFIVTFAMSDLDASHLSWWGHSYDSLLGVVLFNFALVVTVPAWLYEKEPHVDIPTVMHTSTIFSTVLYILIGILGCLTMPDVSDNFLESIMSGALGPAMQIGASVFAFFIIGLNIPLFSILTRLSLLGGGNEDRANTEGNQFCSRPVANLLAVYLPFGLSWTLYQGSKVTALLSWGGMIFTSLVSFLLPLALALYVVTNKFDEYKGSVKIYPWNFSNLISSKESQIWALRILLSLSTLSVAVAIVGNIFATPDE